MRHLLAPILLLALAGTTAARTPAELDAQLQRLAPDLVDATVGVLVGAGAGSGVIVSPDGLVLTAAHVTRTPGEKLTILLSDGRELPATSLGVDHGTDGAMLQINAPGPFPYRPYIKEITYQVGDWAIAAGHPGGPIQDRQPPLRLGRITAAGTDSGFSDPITTSAMVISGDSGGPLFNLAGEVIGINSNIAPNWATNNHVPLPAMLSKWQALLDGGNFGAANSEADDPYETFDQPYAALRKEFLAQLAAHPEDPDAAELLARPRLLDPHHMQHHLDRWNPTAETELAPHFGIRPDIVKNDTARLAGVLPGSPAAQAGLAPGDTITAIDGQPTRNGKSLALRLAALEIDPETPRPVEFTLPGRTVELTPSFKPARGHFPMAITGMIPMQITGDGAASPNSDSQLGDELRATAESLRDATAHTVLPLRRDGKTLAHATVVSTSGELLTKASELGDDKTTLTCHHAGTDHPVTVLAIDKEQDLALLKTTAPDLVPIEWAPAEPATGALLITPVENGILAGIVTGPARRSPAAGHEHEHSTSTPRAYLGVSFSPESTAPIISRVELSSPADAAGLLEGDQILAIDGRTTETTSAVAKRLADRAPGEKVNFKITRAGQEQTIPAILDLRPESEEGSYSRRSAMRDGALTALSERGGKLSTRRRSFPRALHHDQALTPAQCGTPLLDLEGRALGINIARTFRHRSLAIPTREAKATLQKLRAKES